MIQKQCRWHAFVWIVGGEKVGNSSVKTIRVSTSLKGLPSLLLVTMKDACWKRHFVGL